MNQFEMNFIHCAWLSEQPSCLQIFAPESVMWQNVIGIKPEHGGKMWYAIVYRALKVDSIYLVYMF